ncbi:MAG TPA: 30S ribosomal protein S11, partial [Pirellula sp.]|nr:30S ribosomal protein S11 [Pirellula sp.]
MAKTAANTSASVQNKRRKVRRNVTSAVAHVKATFNNTTVTITD